MRKYSWGEKICIDLASQFEHWFLVAYPTIPIALGIWWNRFREVGRAAINCCAVRTESQKKIFNWGGAFSAVIELESEIDSGSVPIWRSNQEMVRLPGGKKGNGNLSQISAQLTCDAVYLLDGRKYSQELFTISILPYIDACMRKQQGYVRQ